MPQDMSVVNGNNSPGETPVEGPNDVWSFEKRKTIITQKLIILKSGGFHEIRQIS